MTRYSPRTGLPTEYQVGPFDSAHIYVQWGGKLPGGEQWSNGMRLAGPSASADADSATILPGVAAAISAFHTRAASKISTLAKLSYVKCNGIGTDGKYLSLGSNIALYADVAGGQAPTVGGVPNQIALAVTWLTGFSRGPAHKGRFYIPLPVTPPGTDGLVNTVDADSIAGSVDTFRTAVNAVNANWKLAVFSRKAGAPAHRLVTDSVIGVVLDTQRRRRRSLGEAYR